MSAAVVEAPPSTKKGQVQRVLKAAGRLPRFLNFGNGLRNGVGWRTNDPRLLSPEPGELPIVILRLQVLGCTDLLSKDLPGTINPLVVVSVLNKKANTPVAKRTVAPVYTAKDSTFDFPIYLSLADRLGVVELVVWDKEMLTKEYLGEGGIPLQDWFGRDETDKQERDYGFEQPGNKPFSLNLVSTRAHTVSTGTIHVKLGFAPNPNTDPKNPMRFDEIYCELLKRSRPSLISAPPTAGVGTIRSHSGLPIQYEDDGGLSSDPDGSDEEIDTNITPSQTKALLDISTPLASTSTPAPDHQSPILSEVSSKAGPSQRRVALPNAPFRLSPTIPTSDDLSTTGPINTTTSPATRFIPNKILDRFSALTGGGVGRAQAQAQTQVQVVAQSSAPHAASPATPDTDVQGRQVPAPLSPSTSSVMDIGVAGGISGVGPVLGTAAAATAAGGARGTNVIGTMKRRDFEFKHANDIIGIVMLEIEGADNLPQWPNATHTGWDMDPFVVVSFSKKVFRTRVIRHSLNPVWDEKLFFHVKRYETSFTIQLTILDWDKLSSNDLVGDATLEVQELIDSAPKPDAETGLYVFPEEPDQKADGEEEMKIFKLELATVKDMPSERKPVIRFRAQYQPYDALRQRFWRKYLKQYDTDDTGALSRLELTAMLDSLGSTLTRSTIAGFFTRYGKNPREDEISTDQAVMCLEKELGKPDEDKKRVDADEELEESVSTTPRMMVAGGRGESEEVQLDFHLGDMDFSGPPHVGAYTTQPMQMLLAHAATGAGKPDPPANNGGVSNAGFTATALGTPSGDVAPVAAKTRWAARKIRFRRTTKPVGTQNQDKDKHDTSMEASTSNFNTNSNTSCILFERVINVKNCPLCHRPRLDSKSEMDIVTHIALCASQDWNKVDQIMVGNFVTASEAERKWYVQVIMDVAAGDYKLGANSANIIVQNRETGQLEEEKMQVYVRLGIRLLYKGFLSEMESEGARRLLKSLSIKQGMKYDDPESAKEIPTFIKFHGLNVDELLDPIDSFRTFNQFFYRKLKPSARPVDSPDDPFRLVSAADCRLMTFESITEATRLWIKGREFTVARLLGELYKEQVERYTGGAVAIFRLAPQDYHRFHSPVEGRIGQMTYISGEYYTVNPQAIRTALDVYGENSRKIVPIDSPQFGQVMAVCIGAMMVGSTRTTVEEGEYVQRGQEFGYFAFGGSTIVVLFEKGSVEWDEDLLINGRGCLETLVRVGMGIGRSVLVRSKQK